MLELVAYLLVGYVAIVVIYKTVEKENFYLGVQESKGTLNYTRLLGTKSIRLLAQAWRTSKVVGTAELKSHEKALLKAGKTIEDEKIQRAKEMITNVNAIFTPAMTALKAEELAAQQRIAEEEAEIAALQAALAK